MDIPIEQRGCVPDSAGTAPNIPAPLSSKPLEDTPIRSVDKMTIGSGRRGPVTETIQRRFFDIINGRAPDTHGWLTYVYPEAERPAAAEAAAGTP